MRCTSALIATILALAGCGDDASEWHLVQEELPGALLSVWGTSSSDVWSVGGDPGDGSGPMVLHYDGAGWTRLATGASGDLWWVFGFAGGPVYMGGKDGLILRYQDDAFTPMTTPGTATVFGIWGASPDDVWAVGGAEGGAGGAFAWKLQGDAWVAAEGFPAELAATDGIWKIFGRAADDVWLVGTRGIAFHHDGSTFTQQASGTTRALFTVHGNAERLVAVGGFGTGVIVENDGTGWIDATPADMMQPTGVFMFEGGGYAVGINGMVWYRDESGWHHEPTHLPIFDGFHAAWVDPDGGVWAVGGQVQAFPLVRGMMIHKGSSITGGYTDDT